MNKFFSSMVGRVFLILLGGVVASAALTLTLAISERREMISQIRSFRTADRVEQLVYALEGASPPTRSGILTAAGSLGIVADFSAPPNDVKQNPALAAALRDRLGPDRHVVATAATDTGCPPRPDRTDVAGPRRSVVCQSVFLTLRDGTPLHLVLETPRDLSLASSRWHPLVYFLIFPVSVGVLAYLVARMATRPLRQLAQAATELGRDIERPPLPETGPVEVRNASAAFNAMQARIRRHVQERTRMLAAITHDLQTPLTRLRLRLEKIKEDELREKLVADLSATQSMIREGLDLARSMHSDEPMQFLDLDSVLDSVCADAADAGQEVTLAGKTGVSLRAQPNALRRCVANLIDNAIKYGGFAHVTAERDGARAVVRVRDGGPGIPEKQLEAVFDPFYRLENSRSRETGGTGLGLTIARNIAEKHGGSLALRNHPDGGLEAVLELPVRGSSDAGRRSNAG